MHLYLLDILSILLDILSILLGILSILAQGHLSM